MNTHFTDYISFIPALIVIGGFLTVIYFLAKKNKNDSKPLGVLLLIAAANWKNYRGKTNRRDFWITYLSYLLIFSFLMAFNIALLDNTLFVLLPVMLVYAVIIFPLASRRLNDTNTSPWWIAVYIISNLIAEVISSKEQTSIYGAFVMLVMLFSLIWIIYKFCCSSYIKRK